MRPIPSAPLRLFSPSPAAVCAAHLLAQCRAPPSQAARPPQPSDQVAPPPPLNRARCPPSARACPGRPTELRGPAPFRPWQRAWPNVAPPLPWAACAARPNRALQPHDACSGAPERRRSPCSSSPTVSLSPNFSPSFPMMRNTIFFSP
jgi:hypothetical protein